MMILRLYSLGSDFKVTGTHEIETMDEAREIVDNHLLGSEYSNLRTTDDEDYSLRFIADPPKGRKGRNVAAIDFYLTK